MKTGLRSTRPFWLVIFLASLILGSFSPLPTLAQDEEATEQVTSAPANTSVTTTTQTQTTTETSSDTAEDAGGDTGTPPESDFSNSELVAIVVMGVAMAVIFGIFLDSVKRSQDRAYQLIETLSLKGIATKIYDIEVFAKRDEVKISSAPDGDSGQEETQLVVFEADIPRQILVNKAGTISATVQGLPNPDVTWTSSEPSIKVTKVGLGAQITGSKVGIFVLKATLTDKDKGDKIIAVRDFGFQVVERLEGVQPTVHVPFMGAGTAAFGVVLILIFLLAFLGVSGVLTGEQVTPIITAIIGAFAGAAGAVAVTEKRDEAA